MFSEDISLVSIKNGEDTKTTKSNDGDSANDLGIDFISIFRWEIATRGLVVLNHGGNLNGIWADMEYQQQDHENLGSKKAGKYRFHVFCLKTMAVER